MVKIQLNTKIKAPIERVFDLARSIDFHKISTKGTNEEAVSGRTEGLIELGETVTWEAKHFGVYQKLTVEVIGFDSPVMFEDVMLKGAFKKMKHTHRFKKDGNETIMTDEFDFESPFGLAGKMIDFFVLKSYMTKLLENRYEVLKIIAEGNEWKKILGK